MANGNNVPCKSVCKGFTWFLQGRHYSTDVLLIPLGTYDLILGAQWLAHFEDVLMNFKKLYLKFYDGDELCELHGKPTRPLK